MLADTIIAASGGRNDGFMLGAIGRLGAEIKQAQRFDVAPELVASAEAVRESDFESRSKALALTKLPFERTWFEWPMDGTARPETVTAARPKPTRFGVLVTTDRTFQRGRMDLAWHHKEHGVNVCLLSTLFDWTDDPRPVPDMIRTGWEMRGKKPDEIAALAVQGARGGVFDTRRTSDETLRADWERFGLMPCPFTVNFLVEVYRKFGPESPQAHALMRGAFNDIEAEPDILRCVLMMLNSRNLTETRPGPDLAKINKARAKGGKPPLLPYSTIRISLSRALHRRAAGGATGAPDGVRAHIVRGHFKVRKTGVFWWAPFMRGDPARGTVARKAHEVVA